MNWKLLAGLACGLVVVGACWGQNALSQPKTGLATKPTTKAAIPTSRVVFGSDLKIKGRFLDGHVYIYRSPGFQSVETVSLQTRTQHHEKNIAPFPQNQVEDVDSYQNKSRSYGSGGQTTPLLKSGLDFNNTDLGRLSIDQQKPKWVRVKVTIIQDIQPQENWTNPTSSVYFGPWLPYSSRASKQ